MRTVMLVLAGCGLILLSSLYAAANQGGKNAAAREIELMGFRTDMPKGNVNEPTKIASAEDLAKAIMDKGWQDKIAKQVDFAKDQLLYFAWSGSGQDKLSFKVEEDKKAPVVVFSYTPGLTRDLRSHVHLFAIPKNASWRVESKK